MGALLCVKLLAPQAAEAGTAYFRTYADPCGINIGTAVVWSAFNAGPGNYRTTLENNFNLVEPENEMKWGEIRPNQATFNYTKSDALIAWAQPRGMKIRGHVLAWHQDNPGWLTGGGFTAAQMSNHLQTHINTVMAHYAGKVYAWDVVNEAFNEDGTLRTSVWHGAPGIGITGTGWIEQAFRWARAADPNAKLYYNDYNNELAGYAKADAVYNMAVDFVNRGVPIDGIGMQMHIVAGSGWPNPAGVRTQINRITALGLDVEITELDVRIQEPVDAAKLAQQASTAQAIIDACLDNPRCKTIQWWGHTDNYSWIPATFPGYNDGLVYDRSYNPKPVYTTMLNELNRPCLSTPSPTRTFTPYLGTPTFSPTASPTPSTQLFDDFEDLDGNNNWGGTWAAYAGGSSSLTLTVGAGGAPGSTLGRALVNGTIGDYGGLTGTFSGSPRDLSGYVGIEFMVRGSGNYWWQVATAAVADGDHYGAAFSATGTWTKVTILFSALGQRGFGAAVPKDLTASQYFQWASSANGAFNLEIDDVRLLSYQVPTATASPSRTRTRTASPSASPTGTRSATASPTASPTASRTAPANTSTWTPTSTASRTTVPNTSTATPTSSASATATPPAMPTATPSVSPIISPTASPTLALPTATSTTVVFSATPSVVIPTQTSTLAVPSSTSTVVVQSPTSTVVVPTETSTVAVPSVTSTLAVPSSTSTVVVQSPTTTVAVPTQTSTVAIPSVTSTMAVPSATSTVVVPTSTSTMILIPMSSRTSTPTGTRTATPSATSTPTLSATPSATSSASPSATLTRTAVVLSSTPSASPSPSFSPTPDLSTATATPQATPDLSGPLVIDKAVAWPNPGPRGVSVLLQGPADAIRLKVYTTAWVLVGSSELAPVAKGWNYVPLPDELRTAPRGLYYFVAQAKQAERQSKPRSGRLFKL